MLNWKLALTTILLFTFVGLPAIGQEMDVPSLKKLDVLAWSSQVMMSKDNTSHLEDHEVEIAEEAGEFDALKEGINKLHELSIPSEHEAGPVYSVAGEPEPTTEEAGLLNFLRNVFSSAMSF